MLIVGLVRGSSLESSTFLSIRSDEKAGTWSEQRKFAGHEFDDKSGYSYMQARYYDPALGRFLSVDPAFRDLSFRLEDPQSMNSYAYARNNPIGYIDPDGRFSTRQMYDAVLVAGSYADRFNDAVTFGQWSRSMDSIQSNAESLGGKIAAGQANAADVAYTVGNVTVNTAMTAVTAVGTGAIIGELGAAGAVVVQGSNVGKIAEKISSINPRSVPLRSDITSPYKRPPGMTTPALRNAVQNKSCATCGATGGKMVPDHTPSLVEEYYTHGKIDISRARTLESVRPQCTHCSNKQGGELSNFSKKMKQKYGFK